MDMSAHFLTRLRSSEYSNDGDLGRYLMFCNPFTAEYSRIELQWVCLVVVNAIESDAKDVHGD